MTTTELQPRIGDLLPTLQAAMESLLGAPSYVVLASGLPEPHRTCGRRTYAWVGDALDLALRDNLSWCGRGPAIVLGDVAIADDLGIELRQRRGANALALLRDRLGSLLAHEFAHVVASGWTFAPLPEGVADALTAATAAWASTEQRAARWSAVPWAGHDGAWLRLAVHSAARIGRRLGLRAVPSVDVSAYRLSSAWRYRAALGNEPERLADLSLDEVRGIRPPSAFVELWQSDVREWFRRSCAPSDSVVDALLQGMNLFAKG